MHQACNFVNSSIDKIIFADLTSLEHFDVKITENDTEHLSLTNKMIKNSNAQMVSSGNREVGVRTFATHHTFFVKYHLRKGIFYRQENHGKDNKQNHVAATQIFSRTLIQITLLIRFYPLTLNPIQNIHLHLT